MSTVFHYVTSGNKIYVTDVQTHKTWDVKRSCIDKFKFDDKLGKPTFSAIWVELDKLPEQVSVLCDKRDRKYVLQEQFSKLNLPATLTPYEYINQPEQVQEMYESVTEREYVEETVIDAEFVHMGEFDIKDPVKFEYVLSGANKSKTDTIGRDAIQYDELGMMFMPSIARSNVPCRIAGKDIYRIIRKHIQKNIDSKVARITSDYDFCFRVERVIQLSEPLLTEYISANGKKSPVIKTERLIPIFEMSPEKKDTYTRVDDLVADNEADLKAKIDTLLGNIMKGINKHQAECPCCKGTGTTDVKIDVNA